MTISNETAIPSPEGRHTIAPDVSPGNLNEKGTKSRGDE